MIDWITQFEYQAPFYCQGLVIMARINDHIKYIYARFMYLNCHWSYWMDATLHVLNSYRCISVYKPFWYNLFNLSMLVNGNNVVVNSLAPGRFGYSIKLLNSKLISTFNILSIFCEIAIRWMPQHPTDHKSTLVQVMIWCRQVTSHYLSYCWPRFLSPNDVTRPQCVDTRT